ncbi:MAG: hypothetical protein JF587_19925 [Catenulisporales bacterium]|nr:hypothetical protein [Catenulisporales bacterium]
MTLATGRAPTNPASAAASGGAGAAAAASVQGQPPEPARPRTDRRLSRLRVVLAVGALLFGAAGIVSTQVRADGADDVKSHSGVLIQQAEEIYHRLSDADATAATIYLHVGEAPKPLLDNYDKDLKAAQSALLAATNEAGGDSAAKNSLDQIAQQLPIYAKLNATAAANNLVGYPVGFRYLTQASNLMQSTILPQAQKLSDTEAKNLSAAEDTATQFPWLMVTAAVILVVVLLVVQVRESRRTNRVFNLGLLGATVGLVLSLLWAASADLVQSGHLDKAKKRGSDQVSILATARILSLQARTDEMLTLVGRGTADNMEADYAGTTDASDHHVPGREELLADTLRDAVGIATDRTGTDLATRASEDEGAWRVQHQALRALDQQNQYQKAVDSALGERSFATGQTGAKQAFDKLQDDLEQAIKHSEDAFRTEAKAGADALTGLQIGLGVLAVAMAGAVLLGLGRRIAEYH